MLESQMTPAEAAKLVEKDRQSRTEAAAQAVQDVLRKHNCDLVAVPSIASDGRIVAVVQISAR